MISTAIGSVTRSLSAIATGTPWSGRLAGLSGRWRASVPYDRARRAGEYPRTGKLDVDNWVRVTG